MIKNQSNEWKTIGVMTTGAMHRGYRGDDQAYTWLQRPAFPRKGREHPLVEKGRRAGLEGWAGET